MFYLLSHANAIDIPTVIAAGSAGGTHMVIRSSDFKIISRVF